MSEIPFDEPLALLAEAFGTDPLYPALPLLEGETSAEPMAATTSQIIAAASLAVSFDGEAGSAQRA